jgi:hypothetical protein
MSLRQLLEQVAPERVHAWAAWTKARPVLEQAPPQPPAAPELLWAGAGGDPEALATALDAWLTADASRVLWLWDRNPGRLLQFCERCAGGADTPAGRLIDAAVGGRLKLLAGAELVAWIAGRSRTIAVAAGPLHAQLFRRELAWVRHGAQGLARPRALLVDGGLLVDELGTALEDEHFGVWTWELGSAGATTLDAEARAVLARTPASDPTGRIFAINHVHGLEQAAARIGAHLHVWEIDPALDAVRRPTSPAAAARAWIHSYRAAQVTAYRTAGWRSEMLPLATDPDKRRPQALSHEERSRYDATVSFVGHSMLSTARAHEPTLQRQLGPARLTSLLATIRSRGAWSASDFEGVPTELVPLIAEVAGAEHRLTVLARLGHALKGIPGASVAAWGDAGWSAIAAHGVTWRGPAGHHVELSKIYSNGGIHLDMPRLYQADIVTLRVFEVLACGGFLVAWENEALRRLFTVGEELVTWRATDELAELVKVWAALPEERARIGAAGRARVLRDHTVRQRLRTMLST